MLGQHKPTLDSKKTHKIPSSAGALPAARCYMHASVHEINKAGTRHFFHAH